MVTHVPPPDHRCALVLDAIAPAMACYCVEPKARRQSARRRERQAKPGANNRGHHKRRPLRTPCVASSSSRCVTAGGRPRSGARLLLSNVCSPCSTGSTTSSVPRRRSRAARCGSSPGPAPGKTTTLTSRVAWLVATGTPAERILLLTFTRRAAREMVAAGPVAHRERRTAAAESACRRRHVPLGRPPGAPTPRHGARAARGLLDPRHVGFLRRDRPGAPGSGSSCVHGAPFPSQGDPARPVLPLRQHAAPTLDGHRRGRAVVRRPGGGRSPTSVGATWRASGRSACSTSTTCSSTGGPPRPIRRLGRQLAGEIDHICVDEYQDVNALQVDVLRSLRSDDQRLTVVGDDAQAVYGFRGASPHHLLDIGAVFPTIATIVLECNYRSTQPILDVANAVGSEAPIGFIARLRSAAGTGERPQLVRCADEDSQVDGGVRPGPRPPGERDRVATPGRPRPRRPSQRPVGARAVPPAHPVREVRRAAFPRGSPREGPHLPLPARRQSARRARLVPAAPTAGRRRSGDARGERSARSASPTRAPGRGADAMAAGRRGTAGSIPPAGRRVVRGGASGARRDSRRSRRDDCATRSSPLIENAYDNAEARCRRSRRARCRSHGATRTLRRRRRPHPRAAQLDRRLAGPPSIDEDWLVISTVHSAKGLEWDVVHLLNAADGNFPSDMALTTKEGLEEERRLFYVAMTRPRRTLHVYYAAAVPLPPAGP